MKTTFKKNKQLLKEKEYVLSTCDFNTFTKVEIRNLKEKIILEAPDNLDAVCERCNTFTPHTFMGIEEDCNHIEPKDTLAYRCTHCDTWNSLTALDIHNLKAFSESGL